MAHLYGEPSIDPIDPRTAAGTADVADPRTAAGTADAAGERAEAEGQERVNGVAAAVAVRSEVGVSRGSSGLLEAARAWKRRRTGEDTDGSKDDR